MEEDIVDIIRKDGRWGVVEGKDEVLRLIEMMEEMANVPEEELGKREPGEPCTFAGEKGRQPSMGNKFRKELRKEKKDTWWELRKEL